MHSGLCGGIITTQTVLFEKLRAMGHEVVLINPDMFKGIKVTILYTLKFPFATFLTVKKILRRENPDAIHIDTEGFVGILFALYLRRKKIPFTTAFHSDLVELGALNFHLPKWIISGYFRFFHSLSSKILIANEGSMEKMWADGILKQNSRVAFWPKTFDIHHYRRTPDGNFLKGYPRPFFVAFGRLSKEKALEDFCDLDLPGTKIVIGSGPSKKQLVQQFGKSVEFFDYDYEKAPSWLSSCDVLVFPSQFDTFGIVILEANACGLPVAGKPVNGSGKVIRHGVNGYLSFDLREAATECLAIPKEKAIQEAKKYTSQRCAKAFIDGLVKIRE